MRLFPLAAILLLACAVSPALAADLPGAWVQLRSDGALDVRAIVPPGTACPQMIADGMPLTVAPRDAPDEDAYQIQVCTGRAPAAAKQISVAGLPAPTLPKTLRRIVILGDTGCRLKGNATQDCNDPAGWPFATVARLAAARHPDLVIHVGDYHYRETACPAGKPGCVGSPFGDNWPVWKADFFDPAAPLLATAPWVMVRGNHELCNRGGIGWFHLLDPHPPSACSATTEPYALTIDRQNLLMFDSADADDDKTDPAKVAGYRTQFQALLAQAKPGAWLLTHRPVWAIGQGGVPLGAVTNITEQAAIRHLVPAGLDMVVAGHIHDFAVYDYGPARPVQLVVGEGGDANDATTQPPKPGWEVDGIKLRHGYAVPDYGFLLLDRVASGWIGHVVGLDNSLIARCEFRGRSATCRPLKH
jgi:hypothetical protein